MAQSCAMTSKDYESSSPLLPFGIDRASRVDFSRQVADGLRASIKAGFFKPGDVLPSVQEMRKALGVSVRAPLAAIRMLVDEGLVASRRHVGCVVLGKNEMSWKGHVLIVYPNITPVFYKSVIEMRMSDRLMRAGYLTTRLMLGGGEQAGYDFSQLALVLKQPISFVFVIGDRPKVFDFLAKSKVPYVGMPHARRAAPGAVGVVHLFRHAADGELAAHCRARGVKTLIQVGSEGSRDFMHSATFRKAGVRLLTRTRSRKSDVRAGVGALVRAAHDAFADWRQGRRDEALFFIDDYIARGAFTAMLENGFRLGDDVRAGTISNLGIDLVYGKDVTRLEYAIAEEADEIASAVIAFLETGAFPAGVAFAPKFILGETL